MGNYYEEMNKNEWAIGIDLGGSKIEVALVNSSGFLHDRLRVPTQPKQGYQAILKRITETIHQLCDKNGDALPSAIGIGIPGQISRSTGIVYYAPNLNWHQVKLEEDLSSMLHKHVRICNDVRAATWGEWLYGAGQNCNDLVCIFIGTGIGGGIVSDGRLLAGCNNTAGEIGHMTIDLHGPECHCGNKGCFEAVAGGWAVARDAQEMVKSDMKSGKILLAIADSEINKITAKTVSEAASKNDPLATIIIDNLADALIAGATALVNAFAPCRLILGGGIMEGIPQLLERIEKGVNKYALKAATKNLEVLPAKLHNDSGVIGAAAFALHSIKTQNS
jgi:glucokinase